MIVSGIGSSILCAFFVRLVFRYFSILALPGTVPLSIEPFKTLNKNRLIYNIIIFQGVVQKTCAVIRVIRAKWSPAELVVIVFILNT